MAVTVKSLIDRVHRAARVAHGPTLAAAGLMLAASSCQTPQKSLPEGYVPPKPQVTSRVQESQRPVPPDPNIHHAVVSDAEHMATVERLGHEAFTGDSDPETASASAPMTDSKVVPASGELCVLPAAATPVTPIVHEVEPRVPIDSPSGKTGSSAEATVYPDEYVCDGGDRGLPFHFNGRRHAGLEPEDTVGEFVDENGDLQVRSSTQACVYAPRFAAVRSVSQPVEDYNVDKLAGTHDGVALAGLERELTPETEAQTDQLSGLSMRSRASGLGAEAGDSSVGQVETTEQHIKIQNVYEDRNFFTEGQLQQGQEPVLAYGIQFAGEWTRDMNPVIVAADESGQQISGRFKAEEYVGTEDRRTPGELEILKTADREFAHPGEELTFTIRFTNHGGRPVYQVQILDHLTPRIEYISGSAFSKLNGVLDVTDESGGTQLLSFQLSEPLEAGQTGEITFRVKVR